MSDDHRRFVATCPPELGLGHGACSDESVDPLSLHGNRGENLLLTGLYTLFIVGNSLESKAPVSFDFFLLFCEWLASEE